MSTSTIIPTVAVEEDFRTRAHNALGDAQLRGNFRKAMDFATRDAGERKRISNFHVCVMSATGAAAFPAAQPSGTYTASVCV